MLRLNDQYKTILSNEQLDDPSFVKEYLQFSFKKRRPEKDAKLYINICKIYEKYPETIKELLDNINKLGYYKDYFHILKYSSRQEDLTNYIFELVVNQIKEDISGMQKKSKISTLGKYLPREKSKVNIKINFIDRFNVVLFPGLSQFTARRKYRKLKTEFNKYLGTLESKLATKDYEGINFNKVSHYALNRNLTVINNHEPAALKLKEYLFNKLKSGSLTYFISCVLSHEFTQDEINNVWEYNRFLMDIPALSNELVANSMCIIDLSKDTFTYKFEYFAIGLALLIDQFSMLKNKVYLAGHGVIDLKGKNITEKAEYLMKLCGPVREMKLEEYTEIAHNLNEGNCKNLIFVTSKNIGPIEEILKDKRITLRQYIPDYGKYYIMYYNGNAIKKFCREHHKDFSSANNEENNENSLKMPIRNINQITVASEELNDFKTPVYIIAFVMMIMFCLNMQLF
ncbi:MAG: hypothetical protein MUO21_02335 [Nitrososphaeraceae archaeon]|nr:hypothetical protein [Nitrososphaeraceae archaeon]